MITRNNITDILVSNIFGFNEINKVYSRHFGPIEGGFDLIYNSASGVFEYPEGVIADRNTTQDRHQQESFVVFLCVAQLFERGYQPWNIVLEGKNYSGTDKGYCDILVVPDNRDDKYKEDQYLIIECKTADLSQKDDEFRKHWIKTLRNGDQLFRYFNTYRRAKYLCLYAADFPEYTKNGHKEHCFENIYHIISLIDNNEYLQTDPNLLSFDQLRREQGSSEEFFKVWKQTYKQDFNTRGLLEEGVKPFEIGKKNYSLSDLKTVDEYSLEKKYNEFAVILRKHTISSHENAFDKLINLFISKIIDEKYNAHQLNLLWKGAAYDDYFSLQDRLNELYRVGMKEFFNDEVTFIENRKIDEAFKFLTSKADVARDTIKRYFRQIKYFNNNPFAFLDVHNEQLFFQNAVILKDVITMLQGIYLTSNTDNQFLGDLFEGFLNKGVHQSEGQFFTPIPIVRFLVSSLPIKQLVEEKKFAPRIIDYACGAGHFLTEYARQVKMVIEELNQQIPQENRIDIAPYFKNIVGIEKDYRLSKVSQVAAFMYGMDGIHIYFSDGLVEIADVKEHSFNVLIANPPYAVSGFLETLSEEERNKYQLHSYVRNIDKNNAIETFFIERASQLLDSRGVATIILPSSILSKGSIYMRTRELILRTFDLISIVCLGPNTFGQTNTNTVALFLRRKAVEPDESMQVSYRVNEWFNGNMKDDEFYKDSELLDSYIKRMGYEREDYLAMMRGELTDTFLAAEMVQEYVKALNIHKQRKNSSSTALAIEAKKVRDEAQRYVKSRAYKNLTPSGKKEAEIFFTLRFIQAIEKEKLYYYLLAAGNPQRVLVVQSPDDKEKEKLFLGYEWSNRKGDEGIHYLNVVIEKKSSSDDEEEEDDTLTQLKGVEGIVTPMFNPLDLNDDTKINSLIRKNFDGEDFEIGEELDGVVNIYSLTDLLDFSRVEFDKVIKTTAMLSYPKIETKYPTEKLGKIAPYIKDKVALDAIEPDSYISTENMLQNRCGVVPYDGVPNIDKVTAYKKGDILVSNIRPYLKKIWMATHDGGCSNDVLVFRNINHAEVISEYLYNILSCDLFFEYAMVGKTGVKMPRGDKKSIMNFDVPLPPIDIQQKIAEECTEINEEYLVNKGKIEKLRMQMKNIFSKSMNANTKIVRLLDICEMKAGKFVPASEIRDIPDENYKYACYGGNGLRGYTNTKTHEGEYIIIGRQGALCGNVCVATGEFHATEHAVVVYPKDNINRYWLKFLLINMNLNQYSTGRAQPGLSVQTLLNVKTVIPISMEIQTEVAENLIRCEVEIQKCNRAIDSVDTRKQIILDKYIK